MSKSTIPATSKPFYPYCKRSLIGRVYFCTIVGFTSKMYGRFSECFGVDKLDRGMKARSKRTLAPKRNRSQSVGRVISIPSFVKFRYSSISFPILCHALLLIVGSRDERQWKNPHFLTVNEIFRHDLPTSSST